MIRIFNDNNLAVIIDTDTWEVTKISEGQAWYTYNNLEAPISYTILQRSPERPLVLHKDYTQFAKEDGTTFIDDLTLQAYLDDVFSTNLTIEEQDGKQSFVNPNGDTLLKVANVDADESLSNILKELKLITFHLSLITENNFTENDIRK